MLNYTRIGVRHKTYTVHEINSMTVNVTRGRHCRKMNSRIYKNRIETYPGSESR